MPRSKSKTPNREEPQDLGILLSRASSLAVLLTVDPPTHIETISEHLLFFEQSSTCVKEKFDPFYFLMSCLDRVRSSRHRTLLQMARTLVEVEDLAEVFPASVIQEWARYWAMRSWCPPRRPELHTEITEPREFSKDRCQVRFENKDAADYAELIAACLRARRQPGFDATAHAEQEATFLSSLGDVDAAVIVRNFDRAKPTPSRLGRPRHARTQLDHQIVDLWNTKRFPTYDDLARHLTTSDREVSADQVRLAVDRARKAKKRRRK